MQIGVFYWGCHIHMVFLCIGILRCSKVVYFMYRNTRSDIKGIVHKIIKICWIFAHPYSIQDVDEFITINGSSAVNGCRENESPNSCLKHHNDSQVIRTTSVYTFMFCEVKSCIFVTNKSIFKSLIFNFKPTSHNIASSSTKVILSESGKKYTQIKTDQNRSDLNKYCDVLISFLDSHSGIHLLQRIHWGASHVMQNISKSVPMKIQTNLHLEWP